MQSHSETLWLGFQHLNFGEARSGSKQFSWTSEDNQQTVSEYFFHEWITWLYILHYISVILSLAGDRWCLIAFWFLFPWWLMIEHIFMYLLAICIFSLEKCLFKSSAYFKIRIVIVESYYFLIRCMLCKHFLLFHRLPFRFVVSFAMPKLFNFDVVPHVDFCFSCLYVWCIIYKKKKVVKEIFLPYVSI